MGNGVQSETPDLNPFFPLGIKVEGNPMREADITHCCISDTESGVSMTGATKHCFFGLMAILLVTAAFVSSVSACD